jgi:hypothetical protein
MTIFFFWCEIPPSFGHEPVLLPDYGIVLSPLGGTSCCQDSECVVDGTGSAVLKSLAQGQRPVLCMTSFIAVLMLNLLLEVLVVAVRAIWGIFINCVSH